jgi:RNA-directed DNA polymerase
MMNGGEKSDPAVVAMKLANETVQAVEEPVEPRAGAKGKAAGSATHRAQDRESVSQGLDRLRQAAQLGRVEKFTTLLHHVSPGQLREAFYALKREAAAGVDGVTWHDYEQTLEPRLEDLHDRVHRGGPYHPLPARRGYIPKADGSRRPLAVAALEDKIVQRAVQEVLSAIYEVEFLGFSYGFRPGRSQHDALDALSTGIIKKKVNWIVDADIRSFFDTVSQEWLIKFLEHRIGDTRMIRLIQKWLKAGVLENGVVTVPEKGTGQGAVISPLLANVYLHYVIDLWAERWRKQEAKGDMIIVRYADDIVAGFEHEADARTYLEAMRKRLEAFSLSLHPDKTRIIRFGRFAAQQRKERGQGKPETFNFLGFTFICGQKRHGGFLLKRQSRADRRRAKLKDIKEELRRRMHESVGQVGTWLGQVVRGYFAYHAVPTNSHALSAFRRQVGRLWYRTLKRRGNKHGTSWAHCISLVERYLPKARIRHPWPEQRFAVNHPRWEPYARKTHVRFCAGGA